MRTIVCEDLDPVNENTEGSREREKEQGLATLALNSLSSSCMGPANFLPSLPHKM